MLKYTGKRKVKIFDIIDTLYFFKCTKCKQTIWSTERNVSICICEVPREKTLKEKIIEFLTVKLPKLIKKFIRNIYVSEVKYAKR